MPELIIEHLNTFQINENQIINENENINLIDICQICSQPVNNKNFCVTNCDHLFHLSCLVKHKICPVCNTVIMNDWIIEIEIEKEIRKKDYRGSIIFTIALIISVIIWCIFIIIKI